MSNEPKVLVELSPEEITWLADVLHDRWAVAVSIGDSEKLQRDKKINNDIRNRILDKAYDQGFGNL